MSGACAARERALAFALAHGDAAARARARVLCGKGSLPEALGLVPEPGPEAPAAAWLPLLGLCGDLGALRDVRVERACDQLGRRLGDDGGFDAGADEETRIQLSGTLGGYLARSPWARPELLDALGCFLAAHWSPDRVQGFRGENLAAYAHFFANAGHEAADEILQWCGRELERGFRTGAFGALRTARVFVLCDAHAFPGARLELAELRGALRAAQADDGGFGEPAEPSLQRVERTLEALSALGHLG